MKLKTMLNTLYYVFTAEDSSERTCGRDIILSQKPENTVFQIFKTIFWINFAIWIPLFFTAIV